MFIVGSSTDRIHQYSLSSAFNIATASYDNVSFSASAQAGDIVSVAFNTDGMKMFVLDLNSRKVYQYSLTSAFNISAVSYDGVSTTVVSSPESFAFSNDGTKMLVLKRSGASVYSYTLSSAFNIATASYDNVSFSVGSQTSSPYGIAVSADGMKMFATGTSGNDLYQYSTASYSTISLPPEVESPPITVSPGKTAITIATVDGGESYQVINVQEDIT